MNTKRKLADKLIATGMSALLAIAFVPAFPIGTAIAENEPEPSQDGTLETVEEAAADTFTSAPSEGDAGIAVMSDDSEEEPAALQEELSVDITYPSTITVGEPVTFTFSSNVDGCQYQPNLLRIYVDNGWQDDCDLHATPYSTNNTFTYTFVAPGRYQFRVWGLDLSVTPRRMASKTIEFNVVASSEQPSLTVEEKAREIADSAKAAGQTQYEQALYVHDYIAANAVYDNDHLYDGVGSVLLRGKGTCESYHRAFALVLSYLGIPCERAEGKGHVWSCVRLDGKWTMIDLTWDDNETATGSNAWQAHVYFGMTDEIATMVHDEHVAKAEYPCNDLANNYFIKSGEIANWEGDTIAAIDAALGVLTPSQLMNGADIEVAAPYHMHPTVFQAIYPVVAYDLNSKPASEWTSLSNADVSVSYARAGTNSGTFTVHAQCAHVYNGTWGSDATNHWKTCTTCGKQDQKATHSFSSWKTTIAATENAGGKEERTCSVCSYKQTRDTEKLTPQKPPTPETPSIAPRTVADGTYIIRSAMNSNLVVDINGASSADGANAQIWTDNYTAAQRFRVIYDGKTGYYTIRNVKSGKMLDVTDSVKKDATNVRQYQSTNSLAQKWIITADASGGYKILSALDKSFALTVTGSKAVNGANLAIYKDVAGASQKFSFARCDSGKNVAEGTYYTLVSALRSDKVIDVSGASKNNHANMQLWQSNNTQAQRFKFEYDNATGYYKIVCACSGKTVDANAALAQNGTNIHQWESNNTLAQRWNVVDTGKGYKIQSAIDSRFVLDINAAATHDGANLQLWVDNGTNAQRFYLK